MTENPSAFKLKYRFAIGIFCGIIYPMLKNDFGKFYQDNLDKIYRFVFFRVAYNKELAEDLVSEIFMKALENFCDYDPKKSSSAWLFTIAKNHLANYWRDHKVTQPLPELAETGQEDSFWRKLAFRCFQIAQFKMDIYELLDHLGTEDRDIVTLHYLFGYSYLEIAEVKEMTEVAVKVAAHRAIKKLREIV